jgi:hypothetical protein
LVFSLIEFQPEWVAPGNLPAPTGCEPTAT